MNIGIGLKCPKGHFKVQTLVGEPKCPICGSRLITDDEAPNTAMNRLCRHCGTAIDFNIFDNDRCPNCGKTWDE
jgi:RNA polymerase subunit RPABC4/transcription elongation factor Spt4